MELVSRLESIARVIKDCPMGDYTSYRTGGKAALLVQPHSVEELVQVLQVLHEEKAPYYVLGNGSNTLVRDGGYAGAVVYLEEGFKTCRVEGQRLIAGGGVLLSTIAKAAAKEGLTGLEFAAGIPGSVGGAVFMNAGAYDGEIRFVLESVTTVSPEGTCQKRMAQELELSYRHSKLMETQEVVVEATFLLQPGDPADIQEKMRDLAQRRSAKQPLQYPSCGSFFKRPTGYFAGKLVEDAGCKGLSVGGAQVSTLHSGFIINTGGATATDILTLMHLVQAKVLEVFGVTLEPEVRIIGED